MAARAPQDVIDRIARSTEQAGMEVTRTPLAGRDALVARWEHRPRRWSLRKLPTFLVAAPFAADDLAFDELRTFVAAAIEHSLRDTGLVARLLWARSPLVAAVAVTEHATPAGQRFARKQPSQRFWAMPLLVVADAATGEVTRPRFVFYIYNRFLMDLIDEHVGGAVGTEEAGV
jgi:hypothetical protein